MEAQTLTLPVQDASQIGAARRLSVTAAEGLGISELEAGKVALVATELATNLVRHGGGGELLVRPLSTAEAAGLEIVALDRGPGMLDLDEAMRDGYSTAGTNGSGLGAVRRLAQGFSVFSAPGVGTAVLARLFFSEPPKAQAPQVAGVSVAKPGETACGDAWCWTADPNGWTAMIADGLGHGPDASVAASAAVRVFLEHPGLDLPALMAATHAALRHTRGAAVAFARLNLPRRKLTFLGLGNVGGTIVSAGRSQSLVSLPGIAGHEFRKLQEFSTRGPTGPSRCCTRTDCRRGGPWTATPRWYRETRRWWRPCSTGISRAGGTT